MYGIQYILRIVASVNWIHIIYVQHINNTNISMQKYQHEKLKNETANLSPNSKQLIQMSRI